MNTTDTSNPTTETAAPTTPETTGTTQANTTYNVLATTGTEADAPNSADASTGNIPATSTESNTAPVTGPTATSPSPANLASVLPLVSTTVAPSGGFFVTPEEYALIQQAKEKSITDRLDTKAKLHSKIFPSRRITVALRRINLKEIAPDYDVVAYIEICNLKAVADKKSEATDQEMAAYLNLFMQGVEPTLAAIEAAVTTG
jgi:hypothetical protein